jgi:predicted PurR-regulated permease PerM
MDTPGIGGRTDFERVTALLAVAVLSLSTFYVLRPFLGALLWAVVMAVAVWPLYLPLAERAGARAAAALVSLVLAAALIAPMVVLGVSLADNVRDVADIARDLVTAGSLPGPPSWVASIPLLGSRIHDFWAGAAADTSGFLESLRPYIDAAAGWILARSAGFGLAILEFLLAVVLVAFLCLNGATAGAVTRRVMDRIGGDRTAELLDIATSTIRSVAAGVLGTAAIQGALSTVGFWLAGVPGVPLLGMACFLTAVAQLGTPLVWIPATAWMYFQDAGGWVIFLIVWNIGVNLSDNFIKPLLIGRSSTMPLTVVFLGVIGGMLAWGFLGMFLGAVLLAVTYQLFQRWVAAGVAAE